MDPMHDLLMLHTYMKLGIAPIGNINHDYGRLMEKLPPEEARKMKRKFRKLWRRAADKHKFKAPYAAQIGIGNPLPTRSMKKFRKGAVAYHVRWNLVIPALRQINEGTNQHNK